MVIEKKSTTWWLMLAALGSGCAGAGPNSGGTQAGEGTQVPVAAAVEALSSTGLTHVPAAMPRMTAASSPNALSPELIATVAAQGSNPLENPTSVVTHYGYHGDGTLQPAYGDVQSSTHNVEATKSEPDKNTYLVLGGQKGADPSYAYGTHFLFQGHELAPGYITRINLDADFAHRVTLMAATDVNGVALPAFDGSTWDPFAKRLVLSAEGSPTTGGLWQATLDVPSQVQDISGAVGRGGYEGIQVDPKGNLWIVEDSGGTKGVMSSHAKQANSFVYRYVPKAVGDLSTGKLQVLQVWNANNQPIVFHAGQADADILSQDVADLHTYGKTFKTTWLTIHDTDVDGVVPYDANALAKAAGATPFKRPENGIFRPGTDFSQFLFTETGDTDSRTEAGSAYGGHGGLFQLTQAAGPGAATGVLKVVFVGDLAHSGFDNLAFWDKDHVVVVEDAGDTLHGQRNALDSGYLLDVNADYSKPANQAVRILAEGRDSAATIDTTLAGQPGYQNEGDNEITGIHVSDGDASVRGLLGARPLRALNPGVRVFFTQQHGDNTTWEILPNNASRFDD